MDELNLEQTEEMFGESGIPADGKGDDDGNDKQACNQPVPDR